jgi:hypothetical protein
MTTEEVRVRLRAKLESTFGAEEASLLMDRPPGGWNDLVTNQMLDARLDALKHELVSELDRRFRSQTWALATLFVAGLGAITAAVRL